MLNANFRDMLNALNDAGAEYLIVGAYAMAAHGCPRATGDIDIWVRPERDNATAVWSALKAFGAPRSQISLDDFTTPNVVYQIGVAPHRIDFLTSIDGVDFGLAWDNRITINVDGISVYVLGVKELLKNKVATGRTKDLLDVEILNKLLE